MRNSSARLKRHIRHTILLFLAVAWPSGLAFSADNGCAGCHPKEAAAYARTSMAHSLTTGVQQPEGSFTHALSGTKFVLSASGAQSWSRGGESSKQDVAYVIGSGSHAFGYLIQIGDHLFQSPVSYYTKRQEWDVAPGYEQAATPDFTRPVTAECVFCHSGKSLPIADTLNRFAARPFVEEGISCERCHGNGDEHRKRPVAGSIVNPAKLTAAARDSVCEQCHLAGEMRIPNPGKSITDFRAGQKLEDTYTVYVAAQKPDAGIKVVSHAEQLALSLCARSSGGKLWCGTCHDPHAASKATAADYRVKCLNCHGASLDPAHAAPGRDCVACHMTAQPARDGGHTAFTDHRITRTRSVETAPSVADDLVAWREPEPALRDRDMAMALVTQGLQDSSADHVIRGYKMLNRVEKNFPADAALETSLGSVLLRAREAQEALKHFQKALALRPEYAPYEVNEAAALKETGESAQAVSHLERALRLDPLLESAVRLLAGMYRVQGQPVKAEELLARYRSEMGIKGARVESGSGGILPNARQ